MLASLAMMAVAMVTLEPPAPAELAASVVAQKAKTPSRYSLRFRVEGSMPDGNRSPF
jgi:hypothetical protein